MEGEKLIQAWLGAVDRVPDDQFEAIASYKELPELVQGNSSLWCERFFAPEANPHLRKPAPRLSCHVATETSPDLLRHQYSVDNLQLDVIESVNFTLIRIRGAANPADVPGLAPRILNVKDSTHQWTFPAPSANQPWVSTSPGADPLSMASWTKRADAGLHQGALTFLCFKKDDQRVGYRDIQGWFGPAFRPR